MGQLPVSPACPGHVVPTAPTEHSPASREHTGASLFWQEVGVCVGGTSAGTQCGVSSSSLAGSTPTPGQQKGDMCPLPRSEAKGAAWGRPDPYRLPDIQGDDATKQGRTHSTVGRGLGTWGKAAIGGLEPAPRDGPRQ